MALTSFQRDLIRLIAQNRKAGGESYVAGGVALNTLLDAPRLSRDIDLFHDSREAVHVAYQADLALLDSAGYHMEIEVERDTFIEALAQKDGGLCRLQWALDSAFRFFPLVDHPELGLTLHPFDLATNKVLALVGRAEPRDWVDTILCDTRLQPLGYLAWAAAGKDPGLNPAFILEQASRSGRYTETELAAVEFEGQRPSAYELAREWKQMLESARAVVSLLPGSEAGKCVHDASGAFVRFDAAALEIELKAGSIRFHPGSLRGALPTLL